MQTKLLFNNLVFSFCSWLKDILTIYQIKNMPEYVINHSLQDVVVLKSYLTLPGVVVNTIEVWN